MTHAVSQADKDVSCMAGWGSLLLMGCQNCIFPFRMGRLCDVSGCAEEIYKDLYNFTDSIPVFFFFLNVFI